MSRIKALLQQTKAILTTRSRKPADRTFLVVDDDTDSRQSICEYLRSFGYRKIIEANNGAAAIALLRSGGIDFVISDWEMPGASGLEVLQALKKDALLKIIPFIMVTSPASNERNKIENAAGLSVDGYIIKPFRSQVLQAKIHEALATANIRGKRAVLIVDDDDEVRGTIREYVEKLGFGPILEAANGSEGFRILKERHQEIAIVLSDWEMPKLQGIDLLKRIRSDPALENTPFIMITSQGSIERIKIEQALSAQVDHYLLKPFRVADLKEKIEMVLAHSKAQLDLECDLTRGEESLSLLRWDEALVAFKEALARDEKSVRAHVGIGVAYRGQGGDQSLQKAVLSFRRAISVNAGAEEAYLELAQTFELVSSLEQAAETLREGVKCCLFSDRLHFQLGRLLMLRGHHERGREELKKALELNPALAEARQLLEGEGGEGKS